MLPRRAKIVLCACVAACAGVWWNVMYLQQSTRADILARTQRRGEAGARSNALPLPTARSEAPAAPSREASGPSIDADVVRAVQRELAHRGYNPGPADGLIHPITRAAVMAYEHDHGLHLTGEPSEELLKSILFGLPGGSNGARGGNPSPQVQEIVRSVQQSLAALGYKISKIDGQLGDETTRAIRAFEAQHRLPSTGRISGALLQELDKAAVRQQRRASSN